MGLFAIRRRSQAQTDERPLSRGTLVGLGAMIGVLGLLVHTNVEVPPLAILSVGTIGVLALLASGLRRPDLPLYVMVAYLPFSKLLTGDFGGIMTALNLTNLLLVVLVVSWFASASTEGAPRFEPNALHVPIFLYAGWGLGTFLWKSICSTTGWYFSYHLADMKRWLDPFVLYVLYFHMVKDKRRWKAVVILIMIGVTVAAAMAVHDYMGVREGTSLNKSRVEGIAGQPNILGAFFVYYMFLFAAFWIQRIRQPASWWLLVPFGLCFRGIMVTFSRGAYLAFAQGLLGFTYFKNKALFLLAVGLMGFALLNPWMLPEGIRYRLESTFKDDTRLTDAYDVSNPEAHLDKSSSTRIFIWRGAMRMIQEEPWTGIGLGRFSENIIDFAPELGGKGIDAHNAYVITAAEFGLPALVFFLWVIAALFRVTSQVYRRHPDAFIRATAHGFLGGLSGLLLANMFGSRLNTSEVSGYFWILAALMARARLWTKAEAATRQAAAPARHRLLRSARVRTAS